MKLTQNSIATKLSDVRIPEGECSFRAFEIASILCDETINWFPGARYNSLEDALATISAALANGKIAIVWLDTGLMDPMISTFRAIHCYFIFDDDPIQCFSVWDSTGATFHDDAFVTRKMTEAIDLFGSDGGVELHVVPPRVGNHAA